MNNQTLLSIQIPYTKEREAETAKLSKELIRQVQENKLQGFVVFELDGRGKEVTIGEKRNDLYQRAKGKYVVQWDSDDWIAKDGVMQIVTALQNNPDVDCVTYEEHCDIDGKIFKSNHSLQYSGWYGEGSHPLHDGFHFHRTPFFKDVIKTEIAKFVPVKHERFGEDHLWAIDLYPNLETEIHIEQPIYHYIHKSSNFNERYGFDRN